MAFVLRPLYMYLYCTYPNYDRPKIGMGDVESRSERDFFLGGDRFVASFGAELFLLDGSAAVDTGEILKCDIVVMVTCDELHVQGGASGRGLGLG